MIYRYAAELADVTCSCFWTCTWTSTDLKLADFYHVMVLGNPRVETSSSKRSCKYHPSSS